MKKIVILSTFLTLLHSTSTFGQLTIPPNLTTTTSSLFQYTSIQFNEGGLLNISQSTPGSFAGNISGPGALTIEGGGDITLTGNNTYTDLTTISDTSSLIVSVTTKGVTTIGSIPPTGSVALGSESSSLTFNIPFGSPGTFSGNISGAGALNLEGGGTLTLSGSNTYKGGTILQGQSTLEGTTETLPSASPIVLNGSSSVNFNQQTPGKPGTFAQAITGTGAVFIEEGYITLTGSNTYTGGTTINNGCQLIGSIGTDTHPGSLPSDGSFMLEGGSSSIVFNQSLGGQPIDGTYSGNFQGSGNVLIEGGGTVTFTGKNNSNGAEITINSSESTLIGSAGTSTTPGSLTSSITNFGTLIFNQPGSTTSTPISYVFSGNISNKGDVTVEGGGGGEENTGLFTLDFIGNNSYTGITTLNTSKGRLQGNIPSSSTWNLAVEGATYDLNGANQSIGGLKGVTGSIVNLGANTLTIGNNNTSTTFSGTIQDAGLGGSLIKVGTGNLTLAQTPNYTGTTEISNGTFTGSLPSNTSLMITSGVFQMSANQSLYALTGSGGSINLGNRKTPFDLQITGDSSFAGSITGAGAFLIGLPGEPVSLTLTGINAYTGGTTIYPGSTLIAAASSLPPGGGGVANNGFLIFNQLQDGTYMNAISGTGKVSLQGGGALTLTGRNTYTGATSISNDNSTLTGTIITNDQGQTNGSLPAAGQYMDDGTLIFSQSSNGIFSGSIQGNGKLIIDGSVSFSSTSSISSSIKIQNNGNLMGNTDSLTGDIVDNGSVIFDQAAAGTYAGKISGTGSLIKDGAARLNMTGESPLTGPTTVKKGILAVNGNLENSFVTVAQEGNLRGNGTVGGVHLKGTVAPGNSIGTLKIRNDFIMEPTSTYKVEITPHKINPQNSDHLMIGGKANLAGTLDVKVLEGTRGDVKNKSFMCLGAKKGRFGEFSNLISDDRLKYKVIYLTKGIEVFVTSLQDFADASSPTSTNNVARTERYFDTFADNTAGRPDLTHVINILDGLLLTENTSLVNNAFNQIQPAQYGDLGGISFLHNELVNKTVSTQQQYLRESRWIDTELRNREGVFANFSPKELSNFRKLVDDKLLSGFNTFEQVAKNQVGPRANFLALGGETKAMRPGNQRIRVGKSSLWVQSYGQIEKSKSNHGNPSIRSQTGGLSIGGDHEVLCNTYLGILGGFSTTPFHWGQDRGYGRMKSYYGGLYGTWLSQTGLYADGQIVAGGDQFHSKRNIKFPGINRIAKQSHKAGQFSANAEVGYAWMLQPFTLQPFLDGTYMFAKEQGFREKGAQSLNFNIKSKTSQFLRGEVGAQIYRTYVLCDALVRPAFQLSYVHKHPISGTHVKGGLIGEPQTLTLLGDSKVRNQVAPGVGVTVQFTKGLYIIANVSTQLGSGQNLGDALLRVGYDF